MSRTLYRKVGVFAILFHLFGIIPGVFCTLLQHSPGSHRNRGTVTDHEMIQQTDFQQQQGIFQTTGNGLIRQAGLAECATMTAAADSLSALSATILGYTQAPSIEP